MTSASPVRIDEVSRYYQPAGRASVARRLLFYVGVSLSFLHLYSSGLSVAVQDLLKVSFLVVVIAHFLMSETLRLYLVPRAEEARRRQLLSDAFGAAISHDRTSQYYNNAYSPSIVRLGANTMENALFSKTITAKMLVNKRLYTAGYGLVWFVLFAFRTTDLGVLTWITQVVFSQAILVQLLNLEMLRRRFEQVYDCLHSHFLHGLGGQTSQALAAILDAFVSYEAAKAAAGLLISTKVFEELNPALTQTWVQIRKDLNMAAGDPASADLHPERES